jgi:hypothetical protein
MSPSRANSYIFPTITNLVTSYMEQRRYGMQVAMKHPDFYEKQMFITGFTRARQWSLSWAR